MAVVSDNTRLASAIVRFLRTDLTDKENSPDRTESLEVAIQCLKLAYEIDEECDSQEEPDLLKIFTKAVPPPKEPEPLSEEKKKEAEKLKQDGNELMKKESFEEAVKSYTEAIQIDSRNAVYFCNRAAAHTGLGNHDSALNDCRKALQIDKKYSKAYSRMGLTYSKLEQYKLAVECYENALKLDPMNEGYKNNMKIAKDKIEEQNNSSFPMPNLDGVGDLGGMAQMMNNPMFLNMAQQVLANPTMQQMAMEMMNNFVGGGNQNSESQTELAGGAQSAPDMSNLLQAGQQFAAQVSQQNPELIDQLRNEVNRSQETNEKDDSG